jgi:protein disulfide-isomerase
MKKTVIFALTILTLIFSGASYADPALPVQPSPYDETAIASVSINSALLEAKATNKDVLLIFGANWCKDCVELDRSLKAQSAALMKKKFVVVKVDVGNFDKNLDIANAYGNPIKKGIPAAVLMKPDRTVLFATHGGELADARHMGDQGIYDFFNTIAEKHY